MDKKVFALDPYLARLHYSGAVQPTEDRLEALHRAQAYTIPFENFDILLGRGVSLEPAALYDKLVHRARGGYCFELNGLLLMALQAFGFEAREWGSLRGMGSVSCERLRFCYRITHRLSLFPAGNQNILWRVWDATNISTRIEIRGC